MIKCPNPECGYQNVDGTQFCEGCGEELPQNTASAAAAPASGAAASGAMIKCPACDNMNPADNVVCEVCGTDLKAGATPTPAIGGGSAAVAASASTTPFDAMTSGTATPAITGAMGSADAGGMSGGASVASAAPDMGPTSVGATAAPSSVPDVSAPALTDTPASSSMPVVAVGDTTSGASPMSSSSPVMPGSDTMSSSIPADPLAATPMSIPPMGTTDPAPTSLPDPQVSVSSFSMPNAADPTTTSGASSTVASSTGATPTATSGELAPGRVKLVVEQGMTVGKQFVLGDSEVQVGREDEEEQIYPDIDLSDQDEGYVHRRHATLKFENGGLTLTHLGGANKTRINNRPLPDNTPENVKMGDKLAFGKVVVRVTPN